VHLVDTHCHLDMIEAEPGEVVAAAAAAGVATLVTVGTDLPSSEVAVELASRFEGVFAAVAVHPNSASGFDARALERLRDLASRPKVVAIGETGLDYHREHAPREAQQSAFRAHIALAKETGKALAIHSRDAHADVLAILAQEGAPDRVVLHCFSGDAELARRCVDLGYYLSFAGNITFSNAGKLREAAAAVALERVLLETDAPFLSPHPLRGKENKPERVVAVAEEIARLSGRAVDEVAEVTSATARLVFGLASGSG